MTQDSQPIPMVVFMEIAEQMNGSCNVETESKGDETNGWNGSSKSKDETASAILATLPFEISEWQVFHYEDFTLTKLACGFFGDVYKVWFYLRKIWLYFEARHLLCCLIYFEGADQILTLFYSYRLRLNMWRRKKLCA